MTESQAFFQKCVLFEDFDYVEPDDGCKLQPVWSIGEIALRAYASERNWFVPGGL